MKHFASGLILAVFCLSSAAFAGAYSDPVIEEDLVATQAAASSAPGTGLVLFLAAVLLYVSTD
jgi:hypothetical protein